MKIAISGAGIAGPALAHWLLRRGNEPTLIEKAPQFRTGGYMIDFWGVGYTVAERMGILPEVIKAGYSLQEVRLVNARGHKVGGFPVDVIRRAVGDRFVSLPRGDLARAIYDSVEGRVETIFGDSISAIEQNDGVVRVSFEKAAPRDFDLVIGADGLHSHVRELVFGPEQQFEKQLGYRVAAFDVPDYQPRDRLAYVGYSTPGRQIARFALRDGRTTFFFIFAAEHAPGAEPQSPQERKALLRKAFGGAGWECPRVLDAMEPLEDIYLDRVSQIRMDRWSNGRVMLIGDAAACVSLLAGEGCGLAMTQAYVLAQELERARDDHRAAFRRHEERLRPFIESKQTSAKSFASAFAPKTRFGMWFRNQVSKLLSIPFAARGALGRSLQDDFDLGAQF